MNDLNDNLSLLKVKKTNQSFEGDKGCLIFN